MYNRAIPAARLYHTRYRELAPNPTDLLIFVPVGNTGIIHETIATVLTRTAAEKVYFGYQFFRVTF